MSRLDDLELADNRRQEHAVLLEQRVNDPEWQPLAKYIRKKLGEEFTLNYDELLFLVKGAHRTPRVMWPGEWPGTVARLLAVLSRRSPKWGRQLLDAMLAGRREQRKKPTEERNALWKRWQEEEQLGPKEIADRWWEQTHEKVTAGAVKQALRRTMHHR
jgi:hypothetical protein